MRVARSRRAVFEVSSWRVRSRVPSLQPKRWMTGTTRTPAPWRSDLSVAKASDSRPAQPSGTSPEGFRATSRPSPEASIPCRARTVRASRSRVSVAWSMSQAGRKPMTSSGVGAGVGAGVGSGVGEGGGVGLGLGVATLASGDGDGVAFGSGCWVTLMQAEATRSTTRRSAGAVQEKRRAPCAGRTRPARSRRRVTEAGPPASGTPYQGSAARDGRPHEWSAAGGQRRPSARGLPLEAASCTMPAVAGRAVPRRRSELRTTLTELKAMAAAASMGSRRRPRTG